MKSKIFNLGYFFVLLLSLQIGGIYSQLDFGESDSDPYPYPNEVDEFVSQENLGRETQGSPVGSDVPAEVVSESPARSADASGSSTTDSKDAASSLTTDSNDAATMDSKDAAKTDSSDAATTDSKDAATTDSNDAATTDSKDAATTDSKDAATADSEDAASDTPTDSKDDASAPDTKDSSGSATTGGDADGEERPARQSPTPARPPPPARQPPARPPPPARQSPARPPPPARQSPSPPGGGGPPNPPPGGQGPPPTLPPQQARGRRPRLRPLGRGYGGPPMVRQAVCNLKADPGFCNLMIGRWYYDRRYHRCLPFLYTGCGGNHNNFFSFNQCESATRRCDMIGHPLLHHPLLRQMTSPFNNFNLMNPFGSLSPNFVLAG